MPEKLAELAAAAEGPAAAMDGWHKHAVANLTFLLKRLGSECTDLQGLRELTVNGLDAIAALGADRPGRVVWNLDWERFDGSGGRVRKLSLVDTGTGMTAGQLRSYINQLAASGREQSPTGNFGVGAKVAAGSRNPHRLEYRSWHQGAGSLVCFKRDLDGRCARTIACGLVFILTDWLPSTARIRARSMPRRRAIRRFSARPTPWAARRKSIGRSIAPLWTTRLQPSAAGRSRCKWASLPRTS